MKLFFLSIGVVLGQRTFWGGKCPTVPRIEDFDLSKVCDRLKIEVRLTDNKVRWNMVRTTAIPNIVPRQKRKMYDGNLYRDRRHLRHR